MPISKESMNDTPLKSLRDHYEERTNHHLKMYLYYDNERKHTTRDEE